jgi:hypothetical protein
MTKEIVIIALKQLIGRQPPKEGVVFLQIEEVSM